MNLGHPYTKVQLGRDKILTSPAGLDWVDRATQTCSADKARLTFNILAGISSKQTTWEVSGNRRIALSAVLLATNRQIQA